ncbi:hypothetical protein [Arthrobacter polaris]|uniref:hypothetical protein n=1 Tax=Arthrobacter polaris TaxID=2813727 RepID=UPI001F1BA529|nr:hypothetical protein [Arthrobacter polaris]UIK88674.1 hypothetical protein J0916_15340 [Arthrobacter polaris]
MGHEFPLQVRANKVRRERWSAVSGARSPERGSWLNTVMLNAVDLTARIAAMTDGAKPMADHRRARARAPGGPLVTP